MRRLAPLLLLLAVAGVFWEMTRRGRSGPLVFHEPVPEWTGSGLCADCHEREYAKWRESTHSKAVRTFSGESVGRPFDGEVFAARDIDHRIGPGAGMTCEGPGGAMRTFPVDYVVGVRRVQMYMTRLGGGRIQVLPVFLEVPRGKWFDYADFVFGGPEDFDIPPDSPNSWYTFARNFNSRCGRCHTTNFEIGYDPDTGTYDSSWSESVIGCEACHGPGGAHVAKWRRLDGGPDPILNAGRLGVDRSNQACGYCHAEGTMVAPGFRPGDDVFAFVDVHGLEDGQRLHPDGRARELIHNLVPLMESPCGPFACTDCHDPHGRERPGDLVARLDQDVLCLPCHQEIAMSLVEHTHHDAPSAGSRCFACHMPRIVVEAGHGGVFDHTISIPSVRNTQRFGIPNACTPCHLEKDAAWEQEHFERWYEGAEERNHRVALAGTVAAGRAARPEAEGPLLALVGHGRPAYRAAAAWMLSGYDADLRPVLDDVHPLVRRAAVKGVAARHPDALVPLLDERSPVLRRAAAMALAEKYDYVRDRPQLRERVLAVLEELARRRPDHARLHFEIGALQEIAGRKGAALLSYGRYLRLRPWDERATAHAAALRTRTE